MHPPIRSIRALLPVLIAGGIGLLSTLGAEPASRPLTESEMAFFRRVSSALQKSLPPGPEGWALDEQSELRLPERIAAGADATPLQGSWRISWKDARSIHLADERIAREKERQAHSKPGPAIENMKAEQDRWSGTLAEAIRRGDRPASDRAAKKLESIASELHQLEARRQAENRSALQKLMPADVHASIVIEVNSIYKAMSADAIGEVACEVGRCLRVEDGGHGPDGWMEGRTLVFLGRWKIEKEGREATATGVPDSSLPYTAVHSVMVEVRADRQRAQQLLSRMDLQSLLALIGK